MRPATWLTTSGGGVGIGWIVGTPGGKPRLAKPPDILERPSVLPAVHRGWDMARTSTTIESIVPGGTYSVTIRADYPNRPGMLGRVASIIGGAGGDISSIDLVEANKQRMVRDITVSAADSAHVRNV